MESDPSLPENSQAKPAARAGYIRRLLPHALALVMLGGAGAGGYFFFEQKTSGLRQRLAYLEEENQSLHDNETALRERIGRDLSKLDAAVDQLAAETAVLAKTSESIHADNQKSHEAAAVIRREAEKYRAEASASLAQLIDNANALVFEPEKHYAILTPSGVRAYPIAIQFEFKSENISYHGYHIDDNLFSSSQSLGDVLLFLSHSAEQPPTARGKIVVFPLSAYKRIPSLIEKEREGEPAFISQFLNAAARDRPSFPPPHDRELDIPWQMRESVHLKAAQTDKALLSMYMGFIAEPLEFGTQKAYLTYESLALVGAETFCPDTAHRDAAHAVFDSLFSAIDKKKQLGLGHYESFGGDSFAQRAASLATLGRRQLTDLVSEAYIAYHGVGAKAVPASPVLDRSASFSGTTSEKSTSPTYKSDKK